jgi:hypothetical protein
VQDERRHAGRKNWVAKQLEPSHPQPVEQPERGPVNVGVEVRVSSGRERVDEGGAGGLKEGVHPERGGE